MAQMLTIGGRLPGIYNQNYAPPPFQFGGQWYGTTAPYAGTTDILSGQADPNTGIDPNATVNDPYEGQTVNVGGTTGQIGGGGGIDYTSMIGGSWEVAQAEAMMAAQMARARDAFTGDLRSAFVNLGYTGDQSKLGNLSQYLDKDTLQNAIANKYSTYNQIAEAQTKANAMNNAQLAARGLLSSGQTSKSASDVIQSAEQNRYNALRSFLTAGSQGLTHIGDVEAQLAQGVMNARFAAAARLAAMYPPTAPQQPAPSGPTGSGYGGGVITDDAQWWLSQPTFYGTSVDEAGNPYDQPLPKWWGQT